jgi:hypothetical protein
MRTRSLLLALAVAPSAVTIRPATGLAQDFSGTAPPLAAPDTGTRFLLSARLLAPWMPVGGTSGDDFLLALSPVALPRFLVGAQIGAIGLGLGINYVQFKSSTELDGDSQDGPQTSMFLVGPTLSYRVAQSAGGRAELHVFGSVSIATGSTEEETDPYYGGGGETITTDRGGLGLDLGVSGRALVVDGFGIDAGVGIDWFRQSTTQDAGDAELTRENSSLQLLGFLGATFLI